MTLEQPDTARLLEAIEAARDLLRDHRGAADLPVPPVAAPLPSLLERCREMQAATAARVPEPIRTLHHFACSGGSLLSRCISAAPNVRLLSEIDPLSPHFTELEVPPFAPSDLLLQLRNSLRPVEDTRVLELFTVTLKALLAQCRARGERLVLRDHAHGHYCWGPDIPDRPSLRAIITGLEAPLSVVTVRDPLASYLSLRRNQWDHYAPKGLDEYLRRYGVFLDDHAGLPIHRYEEIVADPEPGLRRLLRDLDLGYDPRLPDLIAAVSVTGDSGRRGDRIVPRPPRAVPDDLAEEVAASTALRALRARLGYPEDGPEAL